MSIDRYEQFIAERTGKIKLSCTSLIVTLFGDVVTQHGHWISLGSIIDALEPLGMSERLVRTSVYRLVQSEWLMRKKIKKNSYYSFTETAKRHYDNAAKRIYTVERAEWDGSWLLLLPVTVPDDKKSALEKELAWLGFSTLSTGLWAHPSVEKSVLEDTLVELDLLDAVIIFDGKTYMKKSNDTLKNLVKRRWNLDKLSEMYQSILDAYRPLLLDIIDKGAPTPQQAFVIRTLFIHEFRRVLIKDHELPDTMLPYGWVGFETMELAEKLYHILANDSITFVIGTLKNPLGYLPSESKTFSQRFIK